MGLSPVTDAELRAYAAAHQGALHAAGDWMSDNWEYVAGGAMVVAGGGQIAPGGGGPAGLMLVSAGAATIIQKATTGEVNWGQVAVAGAAGGIGFGAGSLVTRAGLTGVRGAMAVGAAGGAAEGGFYGGGAYLTGPGPHTVNGLLTHTAVGTASGAVLGGGGGAAAHGLQTVGGRVLGRLSPEVPVESLIPEPTQGQRLYRVYGGDSAPGGASWSPVDPGHVPHYRDIAGLPSGGPSGANNTGRFVIEGTLNDPSRVVLTREALPLDGMKGGLPEYIVPNWIDDGAITIDRVSGVNPEF